MNKNPTLEELKELMEKNGGSLYLGGRTSLTSLPDGLTVGGSLDLNGCTSLTSLPDGLTVGDWLDLNGTNITTPDHYNRLRDGAYVPNKYIYVDGILTHVKREKRIGEYTYYVGRIPGSDVITDGVNYAHCKSIRDGVTDLNFKKAKDRGAAQYSGYTLESELTPEEAMIMYRIITGACQAGTRQFVDSLGELKDKYTVAEIIELTKGQYNATAFEDFFKNK